MFDQVTVSASSRLHFGLFSFGHLQRRNFGGVGMMIDMPRVRLRVSPAPAFSVSGGVTRRVREAADAWLKFASHQLASKRSDGDKSLRCEIEVVQMPEMHMGLGTGTQLALSVGAALFAFHGMRIPSPGELAASVGRGLRSAVGTYGFLNGGMIVERGKQEGELLSPLDCRMKVPEAWRVSIIQPAEERGLSGQNEVEAFAHCPPVDRKVTLQLEDLAREGMVPALALGDFDRFADSVYRYGELAGSCFETVQGGPYNGQVVSETVRCARDLGVVGVGQSSWGPTIFAFHRDSLEADRFQSELEHALGDRLREVQVAKPDNRGAVVTCPARSMSHMK